MTWSIPRMSERLESPLAFSAQGPERYARTGGTSAIGSIDVAGTLSPEELITLLGAQLLRMDQEIRSDVVRESSNAGLVRAMSGAKSAIDEVASYGEVASDGNEGKTFAKMQSAVDAALAQAPEGSSAQKLLHETKTALQNRMTGADGQGDKTSASWLKQQGETVGAFIENAGHDSQLSMMRIQTKLAERQQAVQLVSGMIQAFNEGAKSVAANIGR